MNYGFILPGGDARDAAELARVAELAGWDGFFVWEPVWGVDAWISLTAAAMVTERIKLGTMLTPLSRMRPWKLASETATLDRLSGGRVILAVGLGAIDSGFAAFGEETDRKIRAELLDEWLEILTELWKGKPITYSGKHYRITPTPFRAAPPPAQPAGIPIWVVGAWPREKSMRRVVKYDGLLPGVFEPDGSQRSPTPAELMEIAAYIRTHRTKDGPFDIVMEGETPGDDPEAAWAAVRPWIGTGVTWWLEGMWSQTDAPDGLSMVRRRLEPGPPRVDGTAGQRV